MRAETKLSSSREAILHFWLWQRESVSSNKHEIMKINRFRFIN